MGGTIKVADAQYSHILLVMEGMNDLNTHIRNAPSRDPMILAPILTTDFTQCLAGLFRYYIKRHKNRPLDLQYPY